MATWCRKANIYCQLISQKETEAIGCDGNCRSCEACVFVEEEE